MLEGLCVFGARRREPRLELGLTLLERAPCRLRGRLEFSAVRVDQPCTRLLPLGRAPFEGGPRFFQRRRALDELGFERRALRLHGPELGASGLEEHRDLRATGLRAFTQLAFLLAGDRALFELGLEVLEPSLSDCVCCFDLLSSAARSSRSPVSCARKASRSAANAAKRSSRSPTRCCRFAA